MHNPHYDESIQRGRHEHGDKFSTSALDAAPQFKPYFGTGQRIKVTRAYDDGSTYTRAGRVSRTTGWRPCFLLMHRDGAFGSSDTLGPEDKIVAVQRNGKYVPA